MGGKKKGGEKKKAKKGGGEDGDEEQERDFMKLYKKKILEYDCPINPTIKKMYDAYDEDAGNEIKKMHLWDELGW